MLAQAALLLSCVSAQLNPPPRTYTGPQHARRSWSAGEIALGGLLAAALLIDRNQTRAATAAGVRESSPIIGPRPSPGQIDTYTIFYGLVTLGTAAIAPRGGWRIGILAFNLGGETAAIQRHRSLGFSIRL